MNSGIIKPNICIFGNIIKLQAKPTITFNKVCPAKILINSRTPKLIGLEKYDTYSIGTSNKANKNRS